MMRTLLIAGVASAALAGCGAAATGLAAIPVNAPTPTPSPRPTEAPPPTPAVTSGMVDNWYSTYHNVCIPALAEDLHAYRMAIGFTRCVSVLTHDIRDLGVGITGNYEVSRLIVDLDAIEACGERFLCNEGNGGATVLSHAVDNDFQALKALTGENAKAA